jgi:hypothetical protein
VALVLAVQCWRLAAVWIEGLYATADLVANGNMAEPSVIVLPPLDVKKAADIPSWKPWNVPTTGLTPEKVVAYHQSTLVNQIAADCDKQLAFEGTNAEDAEGTNAEDLDAKGADAEASVTKEKHNYQPWQWEVFVGLQRSMPDRSVAYVVAYAKQVMPTIFPHANLKKKTAEKWKKKVLALEATREREQQLALQAAPPEELTTAQKSEKRTRNHDSISVADKQEDFQKQIGKGSNRRILPSSVLIGLASLLWVVHNPAYQWILRLRCL